MSSSWNSFFSYIWPYFCYFRQCLLSLVLPLCLAPSWCPPCRCWGLLPSPEIISAPGGRDSASLSLSWWSKCYSANNMCQAQSSIYVSSWLEEGASSCPNRAGTQWVRQSSKCCDMEIITSLTDRLCHKVWDAVGCLHCQSRLLSHAQINVCQDLQGLLYKTLPHTCLYCFKGLFLANKVRGFAFVLEFIRLLWAHCSRKSLWMAAMTSSILAVLLNLLPATNLIGIYSIQFITLVGWFGGCCRKEWDNENTSNLPIPSIQLPQASIQTDDRI